MSSNPTVTVCIACRNAERTIRRAVDSTLSQVNIDIEILLADGGSTDRTVEILKSYGTKVQLVSEFDKGISDAWNKLVSRAKGKWLYFLGADDYFFRSNSLETAIRTIAASKSDICYFPVTYVNSNGDPIRNFGEPWDPAKFRHYGMTFCHQGVFQSSELMKRIGPFDSSFKIAADYELLLRHLKAENATYFPLGGLFAVEIGGISNDHGRMAEILGEYRRARQKNGLHSNSTLFYRVLFGAYVKRIILWTLGRSIGSFAINAVRRLKDKSITSASPTSP